MKRAQVRMLQRFSVEAEVLKQKEPEKYSAVEREVERLREVKKLADETVLKTEIVRHAGRMAAEADSSMRQKLYTRTLALATLHQEKLDASAERKQTPIVPMPAHAPLRLHAEPSTTEPMRLLADAKPRPLPDLASFAERDPTPSPLERRVHKIVLEPTAAPVMQERDTDPVRENDTSQVFVSFVSRDTLKRPTLERSDDVVAETREVPVSLSQISEIRVVDVSLHDRETRIERLEPPQVREVFRDAETLEMPPMRMDPDLRYSATRRAWENQRETEAVRSVYESERRYLDVRMTEPERAERVAAIASTLRFAPELKTREQALVLHAHAWQKRAVETDAKLWRTQEDNLMAVALVARERDDAHVAATREARERLAIAARACEGAERDALKDDLRAFLKRDFSLDAQACRREMNAALEHSGVSDDPRVYALALETHPHRPFRPADDERPRPVPKPIFDEERTDTRQVDIDRMKSELVDLRVAFAFKELSHAGVLRAERLMQSLDAAASRTADKAV